MRRAEERSPEMFPFLGWFGQWADVPSTLIKFNLDIVGFSPYAMVWKEGLK